MNSNISQNTEHKKVSNNDHIYEDIDLKEPPELAPSGVLTKGKAVLKPIAFKPNASPLSSSVSMSSIHHATSPKSVLSQSECSFDDNWYSAEESSGHMRPTNNEHNNEHATFLDTILREKESEICFLRETLEHNEQVIFKVYEEKEQNWRNEFKKLQTIYEKKISTNEVEKKLLEKELEQKEWFLCEKVSEISVLRKQLKETQELLRLKTKQLLSERDDNYEQNLKLKQVLNCLRNELNANSVQMQEEKNVWEQEKQKVIQYQKKLRNSLTNALKRNTTLESQLKQCFNNC